MITFTSLGGATMRLEIDKKNAIVFPKDASVAADLLLMDSPEEEASGSIISWPGEYDVSNVAIRGIGHEEGRRVSYTIDTGKVRCGFLSSPLHDWSDHDLELLGDIDVLCIPGDDAKIAQKIIDEVDPRVLIPLPTKDEKTFEELLKICGAQEKALEDEYKLKGSLPAEGREVVILKPMK